MVRLGPEGPEGVAAYMGQVTSPAFQVVPPPSPGTVAHLGQGLTWDRGSPGTVAHLGQGAHPPGQGLTWDRGSPGTGAHWAQTGLTWDRGSPGSGGHLGQWLTWDSGSPGTGAHLGQWLIWASSSPATGAHLRHRGSQFSHQHDSVSNKINCDMTTLTCSRCMEGWTEHDSRCFFLSGDAKKWLDARSYCIDKGGDLAVVLSEEDQKFLTKLIVKNYKSKEKFNGSWIGLHDMQRERTFRWINGKNLAKYINETGQETDYWVNGQPDNNTPGWSPEGSDCVVLVFELDESTDRAIKNWDDIACRGQRNYMCESKAFIME
uniref:C-type lectin domain family 4 member E-like n=1 Tax=Solea senegalensis TaxID=28829 RepID=UPI001CD822A5|nr:C-type lectin domain family 4 member E-like [Solea senegalensis]